MGSPKEMQWPSNAPRGCRDPPNASSPVGIQRPWDAPQGCRDFEMRGRNSTAQPLWLPGRGMSTRPARCSSRRLRTLACSLRPLHAPAGRLGVGAACGSGGLSSCGRWRRLGARHRPRRAGAQLVPACPASGRNVTLERAPEQPLRGSQGSGCSRPGRV